MTRRISIAMAVLAVAAAGASARSSDPAVNFAGGDSNFTGNCNGGDAMISGSGNTGTIRGGCRSLQIAGDDNRVLIDMAPTGTIKVYGNNNRVSWTSSGEVLVTTVGPGNVVARSR